MLSCVTSRSTMSNCSGQRCISRPFRVLLAVERAHARDVGPHVGMPGVRRQQHEGRRQQLGAVEPLGDRDMCLKS
jgi:hypothetical protein